jgi:hypothetical protein
MAYARAYFKVQVILRLPESIEANRCEPGAREQTPATADVFAVQRLKAAHMPVKVDGGSSTMVPFEPAKVTLPESGVPISTKLPPAIVAAELPGCCSATGGSVISTVAPVPEAIWKLVDV